MLHQILKDMYIDPDVLEALNEEQKKILFLKMRQEQVRRWKEREEKLESEGAGDQMPKSKKGPSKNVSWLLGRDGDVHVNVIEDTDEPMSSTVILSQLRERKGHQTDLRYNLENRSPSVPAQTGTENVSPKPNIRLDFKGVPPSPGPRIVAPSQVKTEDSAPEPNLLPLQEQPGTADDEAVEDEGSDSSGTEDSSDVILLYRPHLTPAHPMSISDRLLARNSQGQVDDVCTSETNGPRPQASQKMEQGKVPQTPAAPQQAEASRTGAEAAGAEAAGGTVAGRGRVAQLKKTFSLANSPGTPSRTKPPVPNKPPHLLASPSLR
ncbi:uncharacterized protein [Paramormyrops kingsleyae]|uniref:Zgc:92242 n=1 Tax=Paramormyrops kingsleyae TaxID=1676925 RepID=A0A3B3R8U5_9TELE|nr:SH2 domain-containing protein 4A-like [Paramormyrops kingsleyae]